MKLLVDMNLSPRWVPVLEEAGFPAIHWSNLGSASATDSEIMAHAKSGGYVVITHDLDFSSILAVTQGEKPSVVQVRAEDVSPESISVQVIAALRQMQAELEAGALLTVQPRRTRLNLLPLRTR